MENEIVRITKLKGIENWAVWKFQVRVILKSNGSWEAISSTPLDRGQEANDTAHNQAIAAWTKNDNTAQRIIATSVEEKPLLHIINCESSKAMWDKLVSIYEQKSETNVHMPLQQWYNLRKGSSDDIVTHIARLEDLTTKSWNPHKLTNERSRI